MSRILRLFIGICVLRANPQDLPVARGLMLLTICSYGVFSFFLASLDPGMAESVVFESATSKAMFSAIVDTFLLVGFAWAALWIRDFPARRIQTITALSGTGTLFQMVALPVNQLLIQMGDEAGLLGDVILLLLMALILWSIVVIGHIMRHALSVSFATGAGAALLYAILSIKVSLFIAAN